MGPKPNRSFEIKDCQIDLTYDWRPEFEQVAPRIRIAVFSNRLIVSAFDDASEGLTQGRTMFAGSPTTAWREVVQAIVTGENQLIWNEDWPESASIAGPSQLRFSFEPTIALKLIALASMGAEWTKAASYIMKYSDEKIETAERHSCLLSLLETASSETQAAFIVKPDDITAEEFFEALIDGIMEHEPPNEVASNLINEHWE